MTEETIMPSSRNPDRKVILVLINDLSAQVSLAIYIVFHTEIVVSGNAG